MCLDPVSMTVLSVAATGMQVYGQIAAGNAADAAAKQNAANLRLQGRQSVNAANLEAEDIRYEGDRFLGQTRAQQAANGIALDAGSAVDVGAESAANIELDALRAIYGGRIKKWQLDAEADIERYKGKVAKRQAYIEAAGTLLGSAAKMGNPFASKSGVPSGGSNFSNFKPGTTPGITRGITPFVAGDY